MRVSVITLGCKVNQSESSVIESGLIHGGHEIVGLREKPDLCIINTCTVTAKSDYQSRQCIRRAWRAGSKVIVTGCYAELQREKVSVMEGVVKVVDNNNKLGIINELTGLTSSVPLYLRDASRSRAFLKVQDGCDYSCSYCLIPAARGRSRSVPVEAVVDRAEDISGLFEEIVLTGIHLGTYGYDLGPKVSLSYLIERILLTRVRRVRLSSLEITEVDEALLELLKDARLCRHLHIPLQSGDDRILRMMRRGYGSIRFRQGIERIIREMPDIAIGTDVIVGFPGEGESEYEHTRSLLESLPFAYLHVFPFSSRPGTHAAALGGQVGSTAKKDRCDGLLELGKAKRKDYMGRQAGKILEALIEERRDDGTATGITGNYLKVHMPTCDAPLRTIVNVRIIDSSDGTLTGIPFEKIKTP